MSLKERMEAGGGKLQTNAIKHLQKQFIKTETLKRMLSPSLTPFFLVTPSLSLCVSQQRPEQLEMETLSAT